jgi:hypothetical protein
VTDPFRPRSAPFPRARLTRAGLDDATVDRLEGAYDAGDARERYAFARYVNTHSDEAIADRYGSGEVPPVEPPVEQPPAEAFAQPVPPTPPTREELEADTVDGLEARIRAWNDEHPEDHLATTGRKAELVGRLLDAYDTGTPAPEAAPAPAEQSAPVTPATEQLPTAPTPTATDGSPETPQEPVATTGAPADTSGTIVAPQEPAQTPGDAVAGNPTTEEPAP